MLDDIIASHIEKMPLIAILRGILPQEASAVSDALVENGFTFMEITLNSPNWQESLTIMKERHGTNIVLGAGTVLSVQSVEQVHELGGQAIIAPNMNEAVIKRTKELGMLSMPGCYSPTECFTALDAGADILKIFPADTLGAPFIKAISAVLPARTPICPTGGVTLETMNSLLNANVYAMGIGSALFKPGKTPDAVGASAAEFCTAFTKLSELPR